MGPQLGNNLLNLGLQDEARQAMTELGYDFDQVPNVPPPRFHTVRYAGALAGASPWRARLAPSPPGQEQQ